MKRFLAVICFLMFAFCVNGQEIPIIKFPDLEKILSSSEKEILVINFWATWCAPCVKELPYFESLHNERTDDVKIVLVCLDFADKIDRVKSFAKRKQMSASMVLLDEVDYNSWIDKIEPSWQGAIPATLIINTKTGQRKFIAKELEEGQLNTIITEFSKG